MARCQGIVLHASSLPAACIILRLSTFFPPITTSDSSCTSTTPIKKTNRRDSVERLRHDGDSHIRWPFPHRQGGRLHRFVLIPATKLSPRRIYCHTLRVTRTHMTGAQMPTYCVTVWDSDSDSDPETGFLMTDLSVRLEVGRLSLDLGPCVCSAQLSGTIVNNVARPLYHHVLRHLL